jgi:WD40 repeat protein
VKSLQIATDRIWSKVFSKNNTVLITGHDDKICMWTLDSSALTTTIDGDWGHTLAIDVTRSGDVVASAGSDCVIRLFDASSGVPLAVYEGYSDPMISVVFSPQEDRLVSTSVDDTVRVWDTRKEAWPLKSSGNPRDLRSVVFSPNGKFIAACIECDILVWDGMNGSFISTLTGHTNPVSSLTFSQTARFWHRLPIWMAYSCGA